MGGGLILLFSSCLFFSFNLFFIIFYIFIPREMAKSLCCLLIYRLIMPWSQIFTSQICLLTLFAYISEFTAVCVVTYVLYMCLINVKGIKNK